MLLLLVLLIIVLLVSGIVARLLKKTKQKVPVKSKSEKSVVCEFERKHTLLSPAEQRFHQELKSALRESHEVSCKVRLEDLLQVKQGKSRSERFGLRNRIKSRHVDFVVIESDSSKIVGLVELDDASHRSARAKEDDTFKDELAKATGLKLVRFTARGAYAADEIHRMLYDRSHGAQAVGSN